MKNKTKIFLILFSLVIIISSCSHTLNNSKKLIPETFILHDAIKNSSLEMYVSYLGTYRNELIENLSPHEYYNNYESIILDAMLLNDTKNCHKIENETLRAKCKNIFKELYFGFFEKEILNKSITEQELRRLIVINENSTKICESVKNDSEYIECKKILNNKYVNFKKKINDSELNKIFPLLQDDIRYRNVLIKKGLIPSITCETCLELYSNDANIMSHEKKCYESNFCSKDDFLSILKNLEKNKTINSDTENQIPNWVIRSRFAETTGDIELFCDGEISCTIRTIFESEMYDADCKTILKNNETNIYYCELLIYVLKNDCNSITNNEKLLKDCLEIVGNKPCKKNNQACISFKEYYEVKYNND